MNHSEYQKSMKSKTLRELEYIIKDAQEAIKANSDNPNNGYYQDEICYAASEKKKRMDKAIPH